MRRWGYLLTVVLILVPGSVALAKSGRVGHSDIAATRMYLRDRHELAQTDSRDAQAAQAAVQALISHVRTGCPGVLAGAPETKVIGQLRWQTLIQVAHAWGEPSRNATILFAKQVKRLRWSNRKLTYYARGEAEEARANAELATPDICTEARAIAASGYQSTPAIMAEYERGENAANSKVTIVVHPHEKGLGSLEEMILRMLKPYERLDEKALIPRRPTEKQLEQALESFFSKATEIITALGLPVPPPTSKLQPLAPTARP